jgi:hypothetical protein
LITPATLLSLRTSRQDEENHCPDNIFTVLAGHVASGKITASQTSNLTPGEEEMGKKLSFWISSRPAHLPTYKRR